MVYCGYIKKCGNPCTNTGKDPTTDGRLLCGTHIKLYLKDGGSQPANTPVTAKKSAYVPVAIKRAVNIEKSNYQNMYDNAKKFIINADPLITLDEKEKEIVINLEKSDKKEFETILKNACKNSSSSTNQVNYQSIANKIPESYFGYKKANLIENRPIRIPLEMFPIRKNAKIYGLPENIIEKSILKPRDLGNQIFYEFSDIDVKILNCKFIDINEWTESSSNIYMGPATDGIFVDSEWFIPQEEKFKLRELQNERDVKVILDKISKGEESAEKYMNLVGKNLGCLCMPNCCHCEVYVEVIRDLKQKII